MGGRVGATECPRLLKFASIEPGTRKNTFFVNVQMSLRYFGNLENSGKHSFMQDHAYSPTYLRNLSSVSSHFVSLR